MGEEWWCGRLGCDLGIDGHDFALALSHIFEQDEEWGEETSERILTRAERGLLGDEGGRHQWGLTAAAPDADETGEEATCSTCGEPMTAPGCQVTPYGPAHTFSDGIAKTARETGEEAGER